MTAKPSDFLDENGQWFCTQCGACCLLAPLLFPDRPEIATLDRGDGGCRHLNKRMRCRIYNDRPPLCNTRLNSPHATELERAIACAGLKTLVDREIETKMRSPIAKKWRLGCHSDTSPTETPATSQKQDKPTEP